MTQPASVGTMSRCALGTANPPTVAFEYRNFGLKLHQEIITTNGIRGTHNHPAERTALGRITCSGPIDLQPGKADLDTLLPLITGSAKVVNSFALAESLLSFYSVVDRVSEVSTYAGCYVARAVFHCAEGEPLELRLEIEALTETNGAAGSFPAGAAFNYQAPYVWYNGVLSIGGVATQFKEGTVTVTNRLKTDRYMNSVSRTDLPFLDRVIEGEFRLPNTSDQAALLAYPGVTAEAFSWVFTQGGDSFTMASSAFQIEPQSPDLPGRDESLLPIHGTFRSASGGTVLPMTFTNVST